MPITRRPAQTLLEAILAIGVILISTIGATTLIITTITAGQSSEDKILAANLAREGIEIVRAQRDSNWLKISENQLDGSNLPYHWNATADNTFNMGETATNDYVVSFSPARDPVLATCGTGATSPNRCVDQVNTIKLWLVHSTTTPRAGFYSSTCPYVSTEWTVCKNSGFSRIIHIDKLSETPTGFSSTIDYLNVSSTVTWNNHGPKSYTLTERLYNWR